MKPLEQIGSGFKRTTNWNKYHSKKQINLRTDILIDPSVKGVNKLFDLSFEGDDGWKSYKQYSQQIFVLIKTS